MPYETTWQKHFCPNHCTKGRALHRIQFLMRKLRTFFQLSFRCQLWCEFLVKFFDIYYTTIMTWEMWYFVIWWCNKTGIVQEISFCLWYLNATGVKITQPLTPCPRLFQWRSQSPGGVWWPGVCVHWVPAPGTGHCSQLDPVRVRRHITVIIHPCC